MATTVPPATSPRPGHASEDTAFFGHPRGLSTLFFTEMWERFSYYGLRPLLVLFMAAALTEGGFGLERTQASAIVGIYAASVYLASLPGGWIADRLLGLRRAILIGAALISMGHISIGASAFAHSKVPFFLGLLLIVLGTGLLKPNISAIVGDLYPEGGARRDAGFSIFYMGINTGAFLGQIVTGFLGEKYGWHWGFGAAGVGMLIGLATFAFMARNTLGNLGEDIVRDPDPVKQAATERNVKVFTALGLVVILGVFAAAAAGVFVPDAQVIGGYMAGVLVGLAILYFAVIFAVGGLTSDEKKRMAVIFVLFVFAAAFWGAFEQAPTSLNLFANDFTDRTFFGWEMPATWFQSINSLFIIIFAPVFAWMWMSMGRRGINLSSPTKFAAGLVLAGIGFLIMVIPANAVVSSGGALKVSAMWLTVSYLFQTLGELSLSPVGLSSMTKLSPRKYVGQMMGIWFLAASVGNLIAGLVGGGVDPEKLEAMPPIFIWTAVALFVSAIILGLLIIPIRKMMASTSAESQAATL
jgi:proton-dependent oligopeptide transporter, POT family